MPTISLCMIVKNEEEVLARCLDSVAWLVDEIVIVDTGSTDRTKEIAAGYTKAIYDFPWVDDFSAARNFSFSKATMDYCMWLDGDDVLSAKDGEALHQLKNSLSPTVDIVMLKYHTAFDRHQQPTCSFYRERLIKNTTQAYWMGEVHEVIPPFGEVIYSDIAISHQKKQTAYTSRNLNIYQNLLSQGKTLSPRSQYYYGRELYYHQNHQEALVVFKNFLAAPDGWIENKIEACQLAAQCCYQLMRQEEALSCLLYSLAFDTPRAEICCDIGNHFLSQNDLSLAIYWYETAQHIGRNDQKGGFISPDCYDFIPYLQLCVCYDRLGDYQQAQQYNEMAGHCKPESPAYLYNKTYFAALSAASASNQS